MIPEPPIEMVDVVPYQSHWHAYLERGIPVLPLPRGRKSPPPRGWTGRGAPFPDFAQCGEWAETSRYHGGNIALRLGFTVQVDCERYEVVGLDVDDYQGKNGARQFRALADELGPLPATWRLTSRVDGVSGIYFFLVAVGLRFKGKAASGIDVVQKAHRYAVTWPSVHPDTGAVYRWHWPDGIERLGFECIPNPAAFPLLPEMWVHYLTDGCVADAVVPIDNDSTPDDLIAWVDSTFLTDGEMCAVMEGAADYWARRIVAEDSSHDKITGADWNLLCLAAEGHPGWRSARDLVVQAYTADPNTRRKRSVDDLRSEVVRSVVNALRKFKAATEAGELAVVARCGCPVPGDDDHAAMVAALARAGDWTPQGTDITRSPYRRAWRPLYRPTYRARSGARRGA